MRISENCGQFGETDAPVQPTKFGHDGIPALAGEPICYINSEKLVAQKKMAIRLLELTLDNARRRFEITLSGFRNICSELGHVRVRS